MQPAATARVTSTARERDGCGLAQSYVPLSKQSPRRAFDEPNEPRSSSHETIARTIYRVQPNGSSFHHTTATGDSLTVFRKALVRKVALQNLLILHYTPILTIQYI